MKKYLLALFALVLPAVSVAAPDGLMIHAVEFGIAKFHRYDHNARRYRADNVWANYIPSARATVERQEVRRNQDGSYSIFFSSGEEMLQAAILISRRERKPIAILNVEAHGMPGGMYFPIDAAARDGEECEEWVGEASGPDKDNYDQYYSATTKEEIMDFRRYAQAATHSPQPCTAGLREWTRIVRRNPEIVQRLANDAEIHFVSCIVGLGLTGENFTRGLAALFFPQRQGKIVTSINYGLGDWSMPEGMGFWDYYDDRQIARDNAIYVRNKSDRDIMQPGKVRVAQTSGGRLASRVHTNVRFFYVDRFLNDQDFGKRVDEIDETPEPASVSHAGKLSKRARIPGTKKFIDLNR